MDTIENNTPASEIPPAAPAGNTHPPAAEPPRSAEIVATGKTEREVNLEKEIAAERARREKLELDKREVEFKAARLEDENSRLRQIPTAPPKAKRKRNWSDPVNTPEEVELD